MKSYIPTQAELKHYLVYEPDTGNFIWKYRDRLLFPRLQAMSRWNSMYAGKIAGKPNKKGYVRIGFQGWGFFAHRLAILYMTGRYPSDGDETDHINHIRSDNSWANLRTVDRVGNGKNQSLYRTNSSGVIGVYWNKRSETWHAQITSAGKRIHIGNYSNIDDARAARKKAEQAEGFHHNHGAAG